MSALDLPILTAAASAAGRAGALAGSDPIRAAWRQLHYAAQAASEVGKSWGEAQPDDSHSSFTWQGTALHGARARGRIPFRAALDVSSLGLSLQGDDGALLAATPLDGMTLPAALAWSRAQAERLAGEPARQPSVPAPHLPPHPIAGGTAFGLGDGAGFAALAALLAGAATLLAEVARQLPVPKPVRIWPHHFDMAVLAAIAPDRTIGVGLAVPEAIEPSGYWYVSPWSARASTAQAGGWPALSHGRWVDGSASLSMAALGLDVWSALPSDDARSAALARFAVECVEACLARLA